MHHGNRIVLRLGAQLVERLGLLHQHVAGGQRRERFGRVGELHDVALLRLEIDGDAVVGVVPILDAAKAPAAMGAVGAGGKEFELFRQSGREIFRQSNSRKLRIHRRFIIVRETAKNCNGFVLCGSVMVSKEAAQLKF